jgi:hypothetical protein
MTREGLLPEGAQRPSPSHCASLQESLHHNKNPARGNISSISLSEENCQNSRRKNSNPQPQGYKELKP